MTSRQAQFILTFFFIAIAVVGWYILMQDTLLPQYNSMNLMEEARWLHTQIRMGQFSDIVPYCLRLENPPLIATVVALWTFLTGFDFDRIMALNAVFSLLLFIALYRIGKRIASRMVGVLAVLICFSFPTVIGMTRIMWLEFPLMCGAVFSYYLLFKTERFSRVTYTLLWGISVGMVFLIRYSAVIYIGLPMALYGAYALIKNRDKGRTIGLVLLGAVIILYLTTWWYFPTIVGILSLIRSNAAGHHTRLLAKLYMTSGSLINLSMGLPFFVMTLVSLPIFLFRMRIEKCVIVMAFIVPLIVRFISPDAMGFINNRYYMPTLPWAALMIATTVSMIKRERWRRYVGYGLEFFVLVQIILLHRGLETGLLFPSPQYKGKYSISQYVTAIGKLTPVRTYVPEDLFERLQTERSPEALRIIALGNFQALESYVRARHIKRYNDHLVWQSFIPTPQGQLQPRYTKGMVANYDIVIVLDEPFIDMGITWSIYNLAPCIDGIREFYSQKDHYLEVLRFKGDLGFEDIIVYKKRNIQE